jgi:acetyltransferase-like isoleucine patch superfamily enzyme
MRILEAPRNMFNILTSACPAWGPLGASPDTSWRGQRNDKFLSLGDFVNFKSFPRRAAIHLIRWLITRLSYIDHNWYMTFYVTFLRRLGYNLTGRPRYISGNTKIDGTNPSLVTIGDKVVISSYVHILTHDFSVASAERALRGLRGETSDLVGRQRPKVAGVSIGENSFIGMYSILMPGTVIGRDCIIGAGSVVRGCVPDGSVVIGNPGQIIRSVYPDQTASGRLAELA